jgi:hypothetical protein
MARYLAGESVTREALPSPALAIRHRPGAGATLPGDWSRRG